MTEPPYRTIGFDDDVPLDEVWRWHKAARPDCPTRKMRLTGSSYRCQTCGWWIALEVPEATGMIDEAPLYFGRDGQPITLWEWSDLFSSEDRFLARGVTGSGQEVSTVWLGVPEYPFTRPPLIFGTAVKEGDEWHEVRRYATEAEAMAGHDEIVRSLK